MNKRSIIINGVKAAEFDLVKNHYYMLNNLVILRKGYVNIRPNHVIAYKLPTEKFKYNIGDTIYNSRVVWRGYIILTHIFQVYMDENNEIKLVKL